MIERWYKSERIETRWREKKNTFRMQSVHSEMHTKGIYIVKYEGRGNESNFCELKTEDIYVIHIWLSQHMATD